MFFLLFLPCAGLCSGAKENFIVEVTLFMFILAPILPSHMRPRHKHPPQLHIGEMIHMGPKCYVYLHSFATNDVDWGKRKREKNVYITNRTIYWTRFNQRGVVQNTLRIMPSNKRRVTALIIKKCGKWILLNVNKWWRSLQGSPLLLLAKLPWINDSSVLRECKLIEKPHTDRRSLEKY